MQPSEEYSPSSTQISKIEKIEDNLDNPPKPTVILGDLPKDEPHGWKYLTVGPDEKLYFQVGAPCNICMPSERHSKIYRVGLDGKGLEVYAYGIRQIVGMDWHPTLKQLYFSENARDWLSEDIPEDKLNRVTQPGKDNFGYPYCHQGNFTDPEFGWGRSCSEFTKPVTLLGPHTAALGLKFYTGNGFGNEYRNAIFLARHGSWNRSVKIGGDVVDHQAERRRQLPVDGAVHHRLHPEQQLRRAAGRRASHEGRLDAGLRRLQRCGLSRQPRWGQSPGSKSRSRPGGARPPGLSACMRNHRTRERCAASSSR